MTKNMEIVFNQVRQIIETKYSSKLPTEDQIYSEADTMRDILSSVYPLSDEEYAELKKRLPESILHSIGYADTLRARDSEHQHGWYALSENDSFFWNRFKTYLARKMEHARRRETS